MDSKCTQASHVKRVFDQVDVKVEKDIVTFNEEKGDDTLVEEGNVVERVTVIFKNPHHCETHQRNIRDRN